MNNEIVIHLEIPDESEISEILESVRGEKVSRKDDAPPCGSPEECMERLSEEWKDLKKFLSIFERLQEMKMFPSKENGTFLFYDRLIGKLIGIRRYAQAAIVLFTSDDGFFAKEIRRISETYGNAEISKMVSSLNDVPDDLFSFDGQMERRAMKLYTELRKMEESFHGEA